MSGIVVGCLYAPNGNPQPGPKFDYKLAWLARLAKHRASARQVGRARDLAGDFNVGRTRLPTSMRRRRTTTMRSCTRQAATRFACCWIKGWTDAIRALHPRETVYTFWDYMRKRWERNAGMRIDHLLLSPSLAPRLKEAGVDRMVRGREGASDHAPAWVNAQRGRNVTATSLSPCGRGVGGSARGTPHPALRATFSRKGRRGSRRAPLGAYWQASQKPWR